MIIVSCFQALADLSEALAQDMPAHERASLLFRRGLVAESLEAVQDSADDFAEAIELDSHMMQVKSAACSLTIL